jgi:hypothetical protein
MCSNDVTAELDTLRTAVMTHFKQHTLSISSTTATAVAAVETAAAELTAAIDRRCDTVREHQRLLRTELDQLITAEQGVYTNIFAHEMQKLTDRLPLSTAELNSGISTALQATTECMLEQLAELVPNAALRDELQNFTAAADAQAFRELPAVSAAITQLRTANSAQLTLQREQADRAAAEAAAQRAQRTAERAEAALTEARAAVAHAERRREQEAAVHEQQLREQRQAAKLQRQQLEADAQHARQLQQQELKAEHTRELQRLEREAALQQQQQQQYEQQYQCEPVYPSAHGVHTYYDRYCEPAAEPLVRMPCSTRGVYIDADGRHRSALTDELDMRFGENRALLVRNGVQYNKDGSRSKRQPRR